MRKNGRFFALLFGLTFMFLLLAGVAIAGSGTYRPHLDIVGFDTLGEPATGTNSEVVVDFDRDFAYVGALFGDNRVKAVDVSEPENPVMTAAVPATGGDPFDVKIAGDILAASTQGPPEVNPGITLMDISDPANPVPVFHLNGAAIKSPDGSHNSYLWADPETGKTWLFATGLDETSLMLFDVTDPTMPIFVAEYAPGDYFVHDNFVQEVDGRVFEYLAGTAGVEILDVTRIVRGGQGGPIDSGDVVSVNHYTSDPADAATVTRPGFAHYIEPTASGDTTWVGDEASCGEPGIVRSFDTTNLPAPGSEPLLLEEKGVIIEKPDADMCNGLIHGQGQSFHSEFQLYRWTGHNFDIWGDDLMIRGDYGRGVDVYQISDPANPFRVAKARGMNLGVGAENRNEGGRDALEHYPFVWGAVYDGDLIYASDMAQGLYILDLIGD